MTCFFLATISNGKLFVFGGLGAFRSAVAAIEEYNSKPRNKSHGGLVICDHDSRIGISRTYYSIRNGELLDTRSVEALLV